MKKLAFIFAIAVIVPSLALAWLAMSALRDQEIVVQSQRALLHQTATDSLAADLNTFMDDVRLYFGGLVDELVIGEDPEFLSQNFNDELKARWGQALVGCVVTEQGQILSPSFDTDDPDAQEFLRYNKLFLSNQTRAEVYATTSPVGNFIEVEEVQSESNDTVNEAFAEKSETVAMDSVAADLLATSALKDDAPMPGKKKVDEKVAQQRPSVSGELKRALALPEPSATEAGSIAPAAIIGGGEGSGGGALVSAAQHGDSGTAEMEDKEEVMSELAVGNALAAPGKSIEIAKGQKNQSQQKVTADNFKYNVAVSSSKLRSSTDSRRDYSSVNNYQQQQLQQDEAEPRLQSRAQQQQGFAAIAEQAPQAELEADAGEGFSAAPGATAPPRARGEVISPINRRTVSPYVQIGNRDDASTQLFSNDQSQLAGPFVNATSWSSISPDNAGLSEIIGDQPEGAIARFLQDGLHVMLWVRHPDAPGKIFWAELDMTQIRERLAEIVAGAAFFQEKNKDVSLALLDSSADIVAQTVDGFTTDWRRPFVASEVGEILPHWEVAAYWLDANSLTKSARTARFTLWMLVPILLAAIGFGSILIFRDVNREMFLARQKTDFVSNVSHELKTPLTSIRMFSDLLSAKKPIETGKRTEYSGIISSEAARLTRLINNLLDFSRMDRGDRKYNLEKLDAVSLARETVENYRLHLEADGCEPEFRNENGESAWINGDPDAVSQVLVNLLSNADKYACNGKEITLEVATPNPETVEIRVLDRGPGISKKDSAKIFEKFYRADDSLSTGIQGSGLGLTLARQIARGHGGDLNFSSREGGGCCFILTLPMLKS